MTKEEQIKTLLRAAKDKENHAGGLAIGMYSSGDIGFMSIAMGLDRMAVRFRRDAERIRIGELVVDSVRIE